MRKLYFFLIGFGLVAAFALLAERVHAQSCGAMLAAEAIPSMPTFCTNQGVLVQSCSVASFPVTDATSGCQTPVGNWTVRTVSTHPIAGTTIGCSGSYPPCNCSAQPDLPGAANIGTREGGKRCVAGCLMKPKGPSFGVKDSNGQTWTTVEDGWTSDGGANCNPFENEEDEGSSGTDPIECEGDVCIKPPEPPDFCGEINGQKICADNGQCEGNAPAGYVCVGAPESNEPSPPDPPDGPSEDRPPDLEHECIINGVICTVRQWKPPFGRAECPEGYNLVGDYCLVEEDEEEEDDPPRVCPDGTRPINNSCPAPYDDCADGTRPRGNPPRCPAPWQTCPNGQAPINGYCTAQNGECPGGAQPVNGTCTAQVGNCPDGSTPQNGMCRPGYANCPNGSRPVDGQCPSGGECDPLTDPNQCEGAGDDNAGGGGTCDAEPFCSGDIILCNVLSQQWRTRCAIEELGGDGEPSESDYGPDGDADGVWADDEGGDQWAGIDSAGWIGGGGGQCPSLGTFSFMDHAINLDEHFPCAALRILAALILAGAFVQAGFIIGRS